MMKGEKRHDFISYFFDSEIGFILRYIGGFFEVLSKVLEIFVQKGFHGYVKNGFTWLGFEFFNNGIHLILKYLILLLLAETRAHD